MPIVDEILKEISSIGFNNKFGVPHEKDEGNEIVQGDCGYGSIDVYYYKDIVVCHDKDKFIFTIKFPPITIDSCEVIVNYSNKINSYCTRGFIDVHPDKKEDVKRKYIDVSECIAREIMKKSQN